MSTTPTPPAPRENLAETVVRESRKPQLTTIQGYPVSFVPEGFELEVHESLLPDPLRKSGEVELNDTDSFIKFVTAEKSPSARIYASVNFRRGEVRFIAVLNEHERYVAHWRDHRASYTPVQSVEWETWKSRNRVVMSQADFAAFLEDNIKDIATRPDMPSGNDILNMALNFEAKQEVIIKSVMRLQNGTGEFTYVDKEDESTVKKMQFFQRFTLGVAPFFNGQAYPLMARLKYKHNASKLTFFYDLIRPDLILQDATRDLIKVIEEGTELPLVLGHP